MRAEKEVFPLSSTVCFNVSVMSCFSADKQSILLLVLTVGSLGIAGTATRIALGDSDMRLMVSSYSTFYCNSIGCFLMGILVAVGKDRSMCDCGILLQSFTIGYCGCLTVFAAWIYSIVSHCSWTSGAGEFFSGIAFPFIFFFVGRDLGEEMGFLQKFFFSSHERVICWILNAIVVIGVIIAILVTEGPKNDIYACLFSPFGAWTRLGLMYFVDNKLKNSDRFKLSTFLANVLAAILYGILVTAEGGDDIVYYLLVGFCGSLSTTSCFVKDTLKIRGNSKKWSYIYSLSSIFLSLGIAIIVWAAANKFC